VSVYYSFLFTLSKVGARVAQSV